MTLVTNLDTARSARPGAGKAVSIASFLRPADTTAYAAGDVISDSSGTAAALVFPGAGRSGAVRNATIVMAETDTTDLDLLLFDAQPTNFADNAALALVLADEAKLFGVFKFLSAAKKNVGTNIEFYAAVDVAGTGADSVPRAFTSADGNLYGLLVTRSIYTPLSANKFTIRLSLERDG